LFGHGAQPQGIIEVEGKPLRHSPQAAIRSGIGFIPEDRRDAGLVLKHTIMENMALPSLRRRASGPWLRLGEERAAMRDLSQKVQVRMAGLDQEVGLLSGGNQQKVVVAKWLANESEILLFSEPTRGVDVGARAEIYRLISEQVAGGASVILFSSDLQEVIGMCDRVLVMRKGRVVAEVGRGSSEEKLLALAMGSTDEEQAG
jgi:ABC-type sugar transport system ATPase subunit